MIVNSKIKEKSCDIFFRMNLITYEWGALVKDLVYSKRFPNDKNAHLAHAKTEFADLLIQLKILISELNFNEDLLVNMGKLRLEEKYLEFDNKEWVDL